MSQLMCQASQEGSTSPGERLRFWLAASFVKTPANEEEITEELRKHEQHQLFLLPTAVKSNL